MRPWWRPSGARPSTEEGAPLARRFTYRYALAIAVFGILVIWILWQNSLALREIDESNRELQAATQQIDRLDSVLTTAAELVAMTNEGEEPSQNDERVYRESVLALEDTQRALVSGSEERGLPGNPTGELEELYFGDDTRLDQEIQAFAGLAGNLPGLLEPGTDSTERDQLVEDLRVAAEPGEGSVSTGLEQAVELYSQGVERAVDGQQSTNQLALFLSVVSASAVVLLLFRPMAHSIQTETTNLLEAERDHRENNERQTFHNQLNQALEGTENEDEVLKAVARAMNQIIGDDPGELLLIDPSQAHLRQAQVNPGVGGPNCPVDSPHACAAIRRGQTVNYDTSRALNVCPKLTQHENAPCSAICSPVMFLGRAIGVVHATGPDLRPVDSTTVERLNVLASETGNRIGTMRATQQTELQASTDGLTGLPNRRSLEQAAHDFVTVDRPFAIAMADLDHFKDLNDTYGHEVGDRALKLFARTVRQNLRPDDIAARYGGEEFVLLLPNASVEEAKRALDRLRITLAGEIAATGNVPFTASWGITTSESGATFDEMIVAADEALYAAKRAGRNRIMVSGMPDPWIESTPEAATAGGEGATGDGHGSAGHDGDGHDASATDDGRDGTVGPAAEADPFADVDTLVDQVIDAADQSLDGACPECGSANPEGSRFCLECGTQLVTASS